MKILQNIESLKKINGGTTFFVTDLSQALAKLGQDISLLSEIDDRFDQEEDLYTPKDEVDTI